MPRGCRITLDRQHQPLSQILLARMLGVVKVATGGQNTTFSWACAARSASWKARSIRPVSSH